MKTKLLCAAIALAVSANSFAIQLNKARVVKHKEWTTGNLKVVFKPANSGQTAQTLQELKQQGIANGNTYVYTSAPGGTFGLVGVPFTINGSNQVYIYNDTQDTQEYNYILSVCAYLDQDQHVKQCGYYSDTVDVDAGGSVTVDQAPTVSLEYAAAGNYATQSSTILLTPDESSVVARAVGSLNLTDDNHAVQKKK